MKLHTTIAILGFTVLWTSTAPAAWGEEEPVPLRVSVFNRSAISLDTIERAEGEASRIFRKVGIEVIWLNCPQDSEREAALGRCAEAFFARHLHLGILRASRGLKASTVGISFSGTDGRGCYADLFDDAVQRLQEETHVSSSLILGHAMAHELGHLLLGTNSHSPTGLMRAHWDRQDLTKASRGNLLFSHEESQRILSRLTQASRGQTKDSTNMVSEGETTPALSTNTYAVLGATAQQEALVRSQIQTMQPPVLPLRVVFVPHWKYVDNARVFHLHMPTGYTSALFTHLPSRTVFIDADRYLNESLGYWLAHELGHLATNSAKEDDAERAAKELRRRLKESRNKELL